MFADLAKQRYVSLTTFRRDGTAAAVPVWVVSDDGGRLLVWTGADTWKVKRIRRDPRVLIAPADYRGREVGPHIQARARVLGPEAEAIVVPLLRRKYGWQRRALEILGLLSSLLRRRPLAASVCLELRLTPSRIGRRGSYTAADSQGCLPSSPSCAESSTDNSAAGCSNSEGGDTAARSRPPGRAVLPPARIPSSRRTRTGLRVLAA
ncbi:MAG TPA: PPOX class F420-dependent oxidoreductase [Streptosporangiaceae bacterium]